MIASGAPRRRCAEINQLSSSPATVRIAILPGIAFLSGIGELKRCGYG